jgi:hypothetical protein
MTCDVWSAYTVIEEEKLRIREVEAADTPVISIRVTELTFSSDM